MESKNVPNLNAVIKKTKGRQKIDMKKISNAQDLQVTFSKRRNGIFKKASELSILCGVEVVVIMFSPSNRVFSFGSPNVDSVIQRYTGWVPPPPLNLDLNEIENTVDERELHEQLAHLSNQIATNKKRDKDMDCLNKAIKNQFWWGNPIESMNNDQIEKYKKKLEELKTSIKEERKKVILAGENSSSSVNGPVTVGLAQSMPNMNGKGHKDGLTFKFF